MTDELEQPTMEEILHLRGLVKLAGMDADGGDLLEPSICTDPQFMHDTDASNLGALRRWVKHWRGRYAAQGGMLDTGMRCVMEGGDVIYLDPEIIVALMDECDALKAKHFRLLKELGGG